MSINKEVFGCNKSTVDGEQIATDNKGKATAEHAKDCSIEKTTRIYNLQTAGDQLIAAGQQLKTFGACTSVGTSLKAAGDHVVASGLSGPGNLLIAAGDSFGEVAASQFGGPGTQARAVTSAPEIQNHPRTSEFSVGISSEQGYKSYNYFSLGASDDGNITDSGPTLEFNRLSESPDLGPLPERSQSSGSSAGSDSDNNGHDEDVIVGSPRPTPYLRGVYERQ